jgi:hypothetical protein
MSRGKECRGCLRIPEGSVSTSALPKFMKSRAHLCNGVLNHLLICHIRFVAHEELVDALGSVTIDLLEPLLHVVERVHVGDIVNNADAVRAPVV